jgi:hypothetical protein
LSRHGAHSLHRRSSDIPPHTATMADTHPELQAKLQELDHELEEGDITTKGSVTASPPRAGRRRRVQWRIPAEPR